MAALCTAAMRCGLPAECNGDRIACAAMCEARLYLTVDMIHGFKALSPSSTASMNACFSNTSCSEQLTDWEVILDWLIVDCTKAIEERLMMIYEDV